MSGKLRALTATLLLGAVALAIGLASAPQLHDRLHQQPGGQHECAATLLAHGNVEHAPNDTFAVPAAPPPQPAVFRFRPQAHLALRLAFSLLEHAPPAGR